MAEHMFRPEDVRLLVPHKGFLRAVPMDRVMISVDDAGRHLGYLVQLDDLPNDEWSRYKQGARCHHHGRKRCEACHQNPANCADNDDGTGCAHYSETGMHWDTCPNRVDPPTIKERANG